MPPFGNQEENKPSFRFTPPMFAAAALAATALALVVIKMIVSGGGTPAAESRPPEANPFSEAAAAGPAANPASRTESLYSGGSIDLFSKTNAGFAGEEAAEGKPEEKTASTPTMKKAEAAAGTAAPKQAAPAPAATAIPRLKPVKTFGTAAGGGAATSGGVPDVSGIMQNVMKDAKEKSGSRR